MIPVSMKKNMVVTRVCLLSKTELELQNQYAAYHC